VSNVVTLHSGRVQAFRVLTETEMRAVEAIVWRAARIDALTLAQANGGGVTWQLDELARAAVENALELGANAKVETLQPRQFDALYWSAVQSFADVRQQIARYGTA
jgi:endonuclease YncB( thermonuclease family)